MSSVTRTYPIQWPESLPTEIKTKFSELSLKSDKGFTDTVKELNAETFFIFMKFVAKDENWKRKYERLYGRINQVYDDVTKIKSTVDKILHMDPIESIKDTYFVIVACSRRLHDLEKLYENISKISFPFELRLSALEDDLTNFEENLKLYSKISEKDNTQLYNEIGKKMADETAKIRVRKTQFYDNFGKNEVHDQVWNKYCNVVKARCKNGLLPFLLMDLDMLGIPHHLSEKMANIGRVILQKAESERKQIDDAQFTAQLATFENEFKEYLGKKDIKPESIEVYCFLEALKKIYDEEKDTKLAPGAIPIKRDSLSENTLSNLWANFKKFVEDYRSDDKLETLMSNLIDYPLPIYLKILAISEKYESKMSIEEDTWKHYFTVHAQNLNGASRQKLLKKFNITPSRGNTPESPKGDSFLETKPSFTHS